MFVTDVIATKPLLKLVIGQRGFSLQNTEGLICSSCTPRKHLRASIGWGSHIRLAEQPQSHMTAMHGHPHPRPPHLTSNCLYQLLHGVQSAKQASEGVSQWGM